MQWLIGRYEFTSPFSLKSSLATSSGGKTNLIPSMFSIKMSLINAAFRAGLNGEEEFKWIKNLEIRIKPPEKACVQNSFVKIQRESRSEVRKEKPDQMFTSTVALREYVIYDGDMWIAFNTNPLNQEKRSLLITLLGYINQLGKRGCFTQLKEIIQDDDLDSGYTFYMGSESILLPNGLTIQYLDDMGENVSFSSINSYNPATAKIGRERIIVPIGVPYQLKKSSRGYSFYLRVE